MGTLGFGSEPRAWSYEGGTGIVRLVSQATGKRPVSLYLSQDRHSDIATVFSIAWDIPLPFYNFSPNTRKPALAQVSLCLLPVL